MVDPDSTQSVYRRFAKLCVNTNINANNTALVYAQARNQAHIKGIIGVAWVNSRDQTWHELYRTHAQISDWPADQQEMYEKQRAEFIAKPLEDLLETPIGKAAVDDLVRISRVFRPINPEKIKEDLSVYRRNHNKTHEQIQDNLTMIEKFKVKYPPVAAELQRDLKYLELRARRMDRDLQEIKI